MTYGTNSGLMNDLIETLRKLGMTDYEAKAMAAITKVGSGTAADIHVLSGIPRSAVYGVLTKLNEKGIIEVQHTKPMKFRAVSPARAFEKLKDDYEAESQKALEMMDNIYRTYEADLKEEIVWTINGVKNVNERMIKMIENAKSEIIFAASYPSFHKIIETYPILNKVKQAIQNSLKKGVTVKITGNTHKDASIIANELPGAEIRTYSSKIKTTPINGGIVVIDDSEVLIAIIRDENGKEDLTAIWSNGKEVISIFKHFAEAEWRACILPK
ncbi:MAG: TrmB family transcriptional regulator [Methanosarcinales archaeon]|nr:TrmB family transcriptional regulator [Methanosarcinales archaeon]